MRQSFILLLLGSALTITGSLACGGNVVVDGNGTSGAGGAGGTATTSTTTVTGVGGLGGVGGAIPPGSSTGNGLPANCVTCAARLLAFEEGVPNNVPLCTGAAATANDALNACACADRCATECAANACIAQPVSTPCLDCLPTSCAQQVATCMNN